MKPIVTLAAAAALALFVPLAAAQQDSNGNEERMERMQQMMEQMKEAETPEERRKLMREHMDAMQKHMKAMRAKMDSKDGGGMHGRMHRDGDADMPMEDRMDAMQKRMTMMQEMMEQMLKQHRMMMLTDEENGVNAEHQDR